MNYATRNALILVILTMTLAMVHGYQIGTTPDYKATLAMIYGATAGMVTCVLLLLLLPFVALARKHWLAHTPPQERAS
jgi:hypothetical protein